MPARRLAMLLLCCLATWLRPGAADAQPSFADVMPNFLGIGAGTAPAYSGSRQQVWGVAPSGRTSLGGERFAAITGPFAELNLIDNPVIQAGPVLNYRFGRSDAEDPQLRALGNLDTGVEVGGRLTLAYFNPGGFPVRARAGIAVVGDASGHYGGVSILPSASLWFPVSRQVFVGAGAAARFAPAAHNRYFYGVTAVGAAASGLPAFEPKGGFTSLTVWPALVWRINESWALGAGLAYTRLSDEVSGSPIVQRGSRDQLITGLGLARSW